MDAANIYTVENFIKAVEELTLYSVEKQGSNLVFADRFERLFAQNGEYAKVEIPLHEITRLCDEASQYEYTFEDSALYSETSYEAAVQVGELIPYFAPKNILDHTSKYGYSFAASDPSKEFLVSLIFSFGADDNQKTPYRGRQFFSNALILSRSKSFWINLGYVQ